MRSVLVLAFVLVASGQAFAQPADTITPTNPRLDPIAFSVGTWLCRGQYNTVPPFTVAHPDVATVVFAPDVGGQWIVGSYRELAAADNPAPLAIKDSITISPFTGGGLRVLFDSNTGGMLGEFSLAGHRLEFTGTYVIAGQGVPFTETVVYADDEQSFTSESRVLGVVFHTQKCIKVH